MHEFQFSGNFSAISDQVSSLLAAPENCGVFLDLNGTLVLPIHAENPREYRQIPNSGEAVAECLRPKRVRNRLTSRPQACATLQEMVVKGVFDCNTLRTLCIKRFK